MAKGISCTVKFGRFKWSKGGYAEAMDGGAVQSMLKGKADSIASSCNADFEPHDGEGDGYAVGRAQGILAKGYRVKTQTAHAHNSERKHNRLLRGL